MDAQAAWRVALKSDHPHLWQLCGTDTAGNCRGSKPCVPGCVCAKAFSTVIPGQISGGELQRFAMLRGLPLDPVSQKEVIAFLLELVRDNGLGVLLVTHDRYLAERISTRIVDLANADEAAMGRSWC